MDPKFLPAPISEPGQAGWEAGTVPIPWLLLMLWRFAVYFTLGFLKKIGCLARCCGVRKRALYVQVDGMPEKRAGYKRVLFIRHGQGYHNVTFKNFGLVDPTLTPVGEEQVARLHAELEPICKHIELVAVSPITRALQTATGGLAGTSAKWAVTPLLREWLVTPCDTGRTAETLREAFPALQSWEGASALPSIWWSSHTEYGIYSRIEQLEEWINARPETTLAVVGHGGLFSRMLGFHMKNCGAHWVEWQPLATAAREMV